MIASASLKRTPATRHTLVSLSRFRGVIASASLKQHDDQRTYKHAVRFRGVIASASLKPASLPARVSAALRFRGVIASASLKRVAINKEVKP